jgi:hypothetical protein
MGKLYCTKFRLITGKRVFSVGVHRKKVRLVRQSMKLEQRAVDLFWFQNEISEWGRVSFTSFLLSSDKNF